VLKSEHKRLKQEISTVCKDLKGTNYDTNYKQLVKLELAQQAVQAISKA
jgi:uncharacterized protein (UPF0335 family)